MMVFSRRSGRWTLGSAPRRRGAALLLAVVVSACASSGTPAPAGTSRSGPNLITAEEISRVSVQNALEAVQKLRPAMLRRPNVASQNAQSSGELVVYVDNTRYGPTENLRQIPASSIASLRYYTASESQMKWGSNHPGGVIEVITKR